MSNAQKGNRSPSDIPPAVIVKRRYFFLMLTLLFVVFSVLLFVQHWYYQSKLENQFNAVLSARADILEEKKRALATYQRMFIEYNNMIKEAKRITTIMHQDSGNLLELAKNQKEFSQQLQAAVNSFYKKAALYAERFDHVSEDLNNLKVLTMFTATPESLRQFAEMAKEEERKKKR